MGGVNTVFQVIHNASGREIIVSVIEDPQGGISEEDQYHAVLFPTIASDQVHDWDQFQSMNENSRPWLVTKVREVIEKEITREQSKLSDALENISKGAPEKPASAAKRVLTKALAIGVILIDGKK